MGIAPSDVDALFVSEEDKQAELEQAMEEAQQMEEAQYAEYDDDTDSDSSVEFGMFGNDLPEAQFGYETHFAPNINQYFGGIARQQGDDYVRNPMANYLPMDLGTKGTPIGAAFMLAEAATDLFGGRKDPNTGLKEGFFRDADIKKARHKASIPSYYDYKVTTKAGDENEYVADKFDLYNAAKNKGSLRTKEQYAQDIAANSQVDFNPNTGFYDTVLSSRPIDRNLLSKDQRNALDNFMEKSVSIQNLNDRFDPETLSMIKKSQREQKGSLGINPMGVASSYKDSESNPYLYDTMMGINTLQNQDTYSTFPGVKLPQQKYGGNTELPKAQVGPPGWLMNSIITTPTVVNDPTSMQNYIQNMGQTNYMQDTQAVADAQLQQRYPGLGSTPQQQQFQNTFTPGTPQLNVSPAVAPPVVGAPDVEITNKFSGNVNRFLDSRPIEGYGKISNFLVNGAGFVNEMFKDKKAREAERRLYKMTQADNMFGYFEDPVNKQGTWDVNTGLAEQDNRVTYMRAQYGGEMENGEIDLDPDTIAMPIAAGANIQIL